MYAPQTQIITGSPQTIRGSGEVARSPLDKVSYSAIIVARNNSAACGCRCGWLLTSTPMSAQPTSRAHARPPCRALDSSARCHCKPPSARCRRAVPWPTPAASAASCPSCCRRLSAVLFHALPAVPRPPCLPVACPGCRARPPSTPGSLPVPARRLLSSRRHT